MSGTPDNVTSANLADAGRLARLRGRLTKTARTFGDGLARLFVGARTLDATLLEELEATLIASDVGVETARTIVAKLTARGTDIDTPTAQRLLRQELLTIVQPCARPLVISGPKPFVIMLVGVNGVGKTTTLAKLARRLHADGRRLLLAAGDTFRAAAVEQLKTWGERLDIPVVAQASGADAAAVAHDALRAAQARGVDVLIVDTAGRQHTHAGLMDELKKIHRTLGKLDAGAPHEVLLVLDATTGQNALSQLQHFDAAVGVTGLVLTKLDGTAKGGVAIAIAQKTGLPLRFIGVGEGADDLLEFDAGAYLDAILGPTP